MSVQEENNSFMILLVDDDADILRLMKTILSLNGYGVMTAANGAECLTCVAQQKVDLIILDVNMPEMDGMTTLRELHSRDKAFAIPVIMLTAAEFLQEYAQQESQVSSYLVKPIEIATLLKEVRKILQQ